MILSEKATKVYEKYFSSDISALRFEYLMQTSDYSIGFQELITYPSALAEIKAYGRYTELIGTSGTAYNLITTYETSENNKNLELAAYNAMFAHTTQTEFNTFYATTSGALGFGLAIDNPNSTYDLAGNDTVVTHIINNTGALEALLNSDEAIKAFSETASSSALIFANVEANKKFKDNIIFRTKNSLPINADAATYGKIYYLNNKYIFFLSNLIYYSSDAITWNNATINLTPPDNDQSIFFDYDTTAGIYIMSVSASGDYVYKSSDLITWTQVLMPQTGTPDGVCSFNNQLYLSIGGYIYRSTSAGATWFQVRFGSGVTYKLHKFKDKLLTYSSANAIDYVDTNNGFNLYISSVIAAAETINYISTSPDYLFFVTKDATTNAPNVNNYIYTLNGLDSNAVVTKYEFGQATEDYDIKKVLYANGIYIAQTGDGYIVGTDGVNWSIKRRDESYILNLSAISNKGIFGFVTDTKFIASNYEIEAAGSNVTTTTTTTIPSEPNQQLSECLATLSGASIVNDGGNKLLLNAHYGYVNNKSYLVNNKSYILTNVPQSEPIAVLNKSIATKIKYFGDPTKRVAKTITGTGSATDGNYFFYYGNVRILVENNITSDNFGNATIWGYNTGDIGATDLLTYHVAGEFDTSADSDTVTVDNTNILINTETC